MWIILLKLPTAKGHISSELQKLQDLIEALLNATMNQTKPTKQYGLYISFFPLTPYINPKLGKIYIYIFPCPHFLPFVVQIRLLFVLHPSKIYTDLGYCVRYCRDSVTAYEVMK